MRIQHNIMAMNAYRNYTNNVSAMKSNLEKLSSGYKINRAGDDAAGLAISEKMRAQITGLQTAQKNAKDGISLVQTAEGALTEVHDMLNRMVELATQSANGTYDDTQDRNQLQKEVNQLLDEINRIADSSNFNGIKLLDGSMDAGGDVSLTKGSFEILKDGATTAGTGKIALPGVGDDLGVDTVLHKGAGSSEGTKFSVDFHNVTFSNDVGATMDIELGDMTITLTGDGTGTMDGAAIVNAIKTATSASANVTSSDVTFDTAGKATIDGESVEITGSGTRLTFTQTGKTAKWLEAPNTVDITGDYDATTAAPNGYVYEAGTKSNATVDATAITFSGKNGLTADEATAFTATVGGVTADFSGANALAAGDDIDTVATKLANALNAAATAKDTADAAADTGHAGYTKISNFAVTAKTDGSGFDITWDETPQTWNTGTSSYDDGTVANKTGTASFSATGISGDDLGAITGNLDVDGSNVAVAGTEVGKLSAGDSWDDVIAAIQTDITAALNAANTTAKGTADTTNTADVGNNDDPSATYVAYSDATVALSDDGTGLEIGIKKATMTPTTEIPDADSVVQGDWNASTTVLNTGKDVTGNRIASTVFKLDDLADNGKIGDNSTLTIGKDTYTFTTDASKAGKEGYVVMGENDTLSTIAQKLTDVAANNATYTVGHDGTNITLTEVVDQKNFDLTTMKGIEESLGFAKATTSPKDDSKGLTLQIGDTADSYNKLKVSIKDMHAKSLGLDGLDISNQASAADAVNKIKDAINMVSDVRGTLGATQNRLDHTINNLSVMTENIQDAESTIRDTDVAEEMMAYTKNNILIQSAQAMLAQANQVPQGVLQLLG